MTTTDTSLDQLCVNTIRALAIDTVQNANSGHPGLPLGAAPMAYALWTRVLKHSPSHPEWPDRDRFVLSAGHGSALALQPPPPHRLRPAARRAEALPPVGQPHAGAPRVRRHAGRRGHDRPARPGLRERASGWRSPSATSPRASTAPATRRRPLHVRDRRRRRPDGGRRARGGVARRPPAASASSSASTTRTASASPARRASRSPTDVRQACSRATAGTCRRVADGNDLDAIDARDRGGEDGRRQAVARRRADADRLRQPEAGHVRRPRLAARRRAGRRDEEGARLPVDGAVLRRAGRARASCGRRSTAARPLEAAWRAKLDAYRAAHPDLAAELERVTAPASCPPAGTRTCRCSRRRQAAGHARRPAARRSTRSPRACPSSSAARPTSTPRRRRRSRARATSRARRSSPPTGRAPWAASGATAGATCTSACASTRWPRSRTASRSTAASSRSAATFFIFSTTCGRRSASPR